MLSTFTGRNRARLALTATTALMAFNFLTGLSMSGDDSETGTGLVQSLFFGGTPGLLICAATVLMFRCVW
ncbi:hypothetical protein [Streptomyces sp. NBC_00258]|uniref:hypothetical protein n=1 Tax=Streptomyces sp. NBC_00258 TaxID=2903642 RepID=UPI002E2DC7A9|nr:hypothetical protein [Streptomyces sp. NBC_00258]